MTDQHQVEKDEGPSEQDIARAELIAERGETRRRIPPGVIALIAILGGVALIVLLLGELFLFVPRPQNNDAAQQPTDATVTLVINANTIEVSAGGRLMTVRYIGIAVPAEGSPFAGLAITANRQWIAGKAVVLEGDQVDRDDGGNFLRYVYVDGAMVNAALLAAGLASTAPPQTNRRYYDEFQAIEAEARGAGRGIWSAASQSLSVPPPHTVGGP